MTSSARPPKSTGEEAFVARLRERLGPAAAKLIGDDAALLSLAGDWAITVDAQIEGVHLPPELDPGLVAHRLLAVNLSDLAAVGADPAYGFLTISAPSDWDRGAFLDGFAAATSATDLIIAGGDVTTGPVVALTLTLLGNRPSSRRWVRRSGALPGDRLWVSGPLGYSGLGRHLLARRAGWRLGKAELPVALGLDRCLEPAATAAIERHLMPVPRLSAGRWLGEQTRAAAIDISDGLSKDLHRLLESSEVGATLQRRRIPCLDVDASAIAVHLGLDPFDLALAGGEDYELIAALPSDLVPPAAEGWTEIGRAEKAPGLRLDDRGHVTNIPAVGWDHLAPRD